MATLESNNKETERQEEKGGKERETGRKLEESNVNII